MGERCDVFRLEPSGTPLGLLEDSQFASGLFQLKKDDVLVLYGRQDLNLDFEARLLGRRTSATKSNPAVRQGTE